VARESVLVDAGPLVAFLSHGDGHHRWAEALFAQLRPPLLTSEPVITEAAYLVTAYGGPEVAVLELIQRGIVKVEFDVQSHIGPLMGLMQRYSNLPMSLADASLVQMTELNNRTRVLTLDNDFLIYRRNGRQRIPVLMPD
jgi:uncharacterized protein